MRNNKTTIKIILALIVAFLATLISYNVFNNLQSQVSEKEKLIEVMQKTQADNRKETYAYAVATADLKSGQIVSDEDVDFKQFDTMNSDAFENRSDVVNKILLKNISSGEVFTTAHIAKISNDDVTLKDGYRALTLPSDNFQGRSDTMTPGTFIDICSSSSDSSWVLEHIKIMSFENNGKSSVSDKTVTINNASAITFEVPVDNITDFISNISKGKLVLVARGQNDKKIYHKTPKPTYNDYSVGAYSELPNLPKSVPIKNLSGLPEPFSPDIQQPSVEVIEANVKSKVTFE